MESYLLTTLRTVAWIKKAHDEQALEMKPPFQRNPVWSEVQKAYLIDTILNGYPIPELYMQEDVDSDGMERHIVVDGQQRIRACLEYLEGKFALDPEHTPSLGNMTFEELSEENKKKIYAYQFVVRRLPAVDDSQIRAIFARLNKNVVALNQQELRHATYGGEFIRCMERIADLEYWEGTGLFTPNAVRRMLDVEYISELTIALLHGPQNKKKSIDEWYAAYEKGFEDSLRVERLFAKILGELSHVLPDIRSTRWRKRSDFYTLFAVLAEHEVSLPLDKKGRKLLGDLLRTFSLAVDAMIEARRIGESVKSDRSSTEDVIRGYLSAVERAASDLANRKRRFEALSQFLERAWN